jgi:CO/xanthine dehydrogenase FAD-binding subunit
MTDVPLRLKAVERALVGARPDPTKLRGPIGAALADALVNADLHASAAYRRRVAATLALRAVGDAVAQAKRGAHAH